MLSDVNCTSEWFLRSGTFGRDDTGHRTAPTLVECQKACEFDPRCLSFDLDSDGNGGCDLSTDPNHQHGSRSTRNHYDLLSRCNVTLGQCFDSNDALHSEN